jgi:hypothetical protein
MCGFSQKSYDRIHKLDFEKVKKNITSLVRVAKEAGYDSRNIFITYHVYQFNTTEVFAMQDFADSLDIGTFPHYAFINDPKLFRQYADGTLDVQNWKEISQDIFLYYIQRKLDNHPRNGCSQFDVLTIDEKYNVLPCCCLERDHKSYTFTNILNNDFLEKLSQWQPDGYCLACIQKGWSQTGGELDVSMFELPKHRKQLSEYSGKELLKELCKKIKNRIRL